MCPKLKNTGNAKKKVSSDNLDSSSCLVEDDWCLGEFRGASSNRSRPPAEGDNSQGGWRKRWAPALEVCDGRLLEDTKI